jgi:integrase
MTCDNYVYIRSYKSTITAFEVLTMLNTSLELTNGAGDNLLTITDLRESKEHRWNAQGVNITLEKAVEAHLTEVSNQNTARAKSIDLRQLVGFLNCNGYLTIGHLGKLISPELKLLIENFLDGLELGKATLQRKRASIKVWFDFLHFNFPKLITFVPRLDSDRYKLTRNKGVTKALELEEWFRLKQELGRSVRNPRLLVLCQCALLLGGRRISELLNLKWSDLDFEKQVVMVRPSKKGSDETAHYLPMTAQLKIVLMEYCDSIGEIDESGRVFSVSQQSVDESLKRYGLKAGIRGISFHTLRATFITWANERGDTQSEIMNASLHASSQMVRYYDRTSELKTNSINKMGMV